MSIFRAYDIRGIYGEDLTAEIMKKIGMSAQELIIDKIPAINE